MSVEEKEEELNEQLQELWSLCCKAKEDRNISRSHLRSINKMHTSLRGDKKVTAVVRNKLKALYNRSMKKSEQGMKALKAVLTKIQEVRTMKEKLKLARGGQGVLRRGVLMSILQENAKILPLWLGDPHEPLPPLVGCIPADEDYICQVGDKVAARVTEQEEENWILAEVVRYNSNNGKYEVDDVDAEEGKERYWLSRAEVLPLPLYKVDPQVNPEAIFPKATDVLALYPQTTCFYKAMVEDTPKTVHDEYRLVFEDPSYPEGFAPSLRIPQRYIILSPYQDSS